eukprot:5723205-Karenia_brevis.AAC.1
MHTFANQEQVQRMLHYFYHFGELGGREPNLATMKERYFAGNPYARFVSDLGDASTQKCENR